MKSRKSIAEEVDKKNKDVGMEEFTFEEPDDYDSVREKFEILGIEMDIHKNGVLYLKELVLDFVFSNSNRKYSYCS